MPQGTREELPISHQELKAELARLRAAFRRSEETREMLAQQIVKAEEDERGRISRELHDHVAQHVIAIMLELRALESESDCDRVSEIFESLRTLTGGLDRELHQIAVDLRPAGRNGLGLTDSLPNYLEGWSKRAGIIIDFESSGLDGVRLPEHIEATVHRIVQEGLNNILKHANAKIASISIQRVENHLVVTIEDDGAGFDTTALRTRGGERLGLAVMSERAAALGGEMSVDSRPGQGTTLWMRIPMVAVGMMIRGPDASESEP